MTLKPILANRARLFWILHIGGWLAYAGAAALNAMQYEPKDWYFQWIYSVALLGFTLSLTLRYLYRRIWNQPPANLILLAFSGCFSVAIVWRVATNNLYWMKVKHGWTPDSWMEQHLSGVMTAFYVLACWSGLYFGIKLYQQYQEQARETLKANAAAHQAQLKMLRYQLNPHFLFNTLNAISTLILERANETANTTVTRLSDFLRYTLDNDPNNQVTLRKELEAIDLYLEIEKVRFAERLTVRKEIEVAALNSRVPSLILQPLVENAIKYAITPREDGGTILISAKVSNRMLSITVADDGPGLSESRSGGTGSTGVGLRNIRERLQHLYGENQSFRLADAQPSGLAATLELPHESDE